MEQRGKRDESREGNEMEAEREMRFNREGNEMGAEREMRWSREGKYGDNIRPV